MPCQLNNVVKYMLPRIAWFGLGGVSWGSSSAILPGGSHCLILVVRSSFFSSRKYCTINAIILPTLKDYYEASEA